MRHGAISKDNETIVCLPNRVVVRIESEGGDYDAVI
ncbi:MAG: NusG domain II-containing protein [Firmicutes bacterium]|nr:NusG domain II-containing protein [Bacillota bacterium]